MQIFSFFFLQNMTKDIVAKSMRIEGRGEAIIHNIQFCEKSSKLQQNSSEKVINFLKIILDFPE